MAPGGGCAAGLPRPAGASRGRGRITAAGSQVWQISSLSWALLPLLLPFLTDAVCVLSARPPFHPLTCEIGVAILIGGLEKKCLSCFIARTRVLFLKVFAAVLK